MLWLSEGHGRGLFAALLLLLLPGLVSATTLHVPSAFSTIGAANGVASPGDTILVSAGTYAEEVLQLVAGVRLLSQSGSAVTTLELGQIKLHTSMGSPPTTIIDGFHLHSEFTPISIGNVPNTVISNNRITNGEYFACVVSRSPVTLIGNWIEGGIPYYLSYDQLASEVGSLVIVDNVLINTITSFSVPSCLSVTTNLDCPPLVTDVVFDHNTVVGAVGDGCDVGWFLCQTATISNSIFYRTAFRHCEPGEIVFSHTTLFDASGCVGSPDGTNLFVDPLFCDPDGSEGVYDMRLQPGSPAIGAADDESNMGAPLPPGCEIVTVTPSTTPSRILAIAPNPTTGPTTFTVGGDRRGSRVRIFDARGRLVAELPPSGSGRISWDGMKESGSPVAPGVYYVAISRNGVVETRRAFVVVR